MIARAEHGRPQRAAPVTTSASLLRKIRGNAINPAKRLRSDGAAMLKPGACSNPGHAQSRGMPKAEVATLQRFRRAPLVVDQFMANRDESFHRLCPSGVFHHHDAKRERQRTTFERQVNQLVAVK
jgi:hypothetical protein